MIDHVDVAVECKYADNKKSELAVEEVGHPAAEVARFLGISRMGVQKAVIRGSELKGDQVSLG